MNRKIRQSRSLCLVKDQLTQRKNQEKNPEKNLEGLCLIPIRVGNFGNKIMYIKSVL